MMSSHHPPSCRRRLHGMAHSEPGYGTETIGDLPVCVLCRLDVHGTRAGDDHGSPSQLFLLGKNRHAPSQGQGRLRSMGRRAAGGGGGGGFAAHGSHHSGPHQPLRFRWSCRGSSVVRARLLYRLLALGRWRLPLCPLYACLCACRTRQRGGFMRRVYQWSEE